MTHTVEGQPHLGYRVIDSELGALTGRKATEAEALKAAGIKPETPTKKAAAKKSE